MTQRELPTLGVLGIATGKVLEDGGFAKIHEALDHLYPGIMTIGCAAVAQTAAKEVMRQHPEISDLGECTSDNYVDYARRALDKFGPSIILDGPHGTGNPDMINA